MSKFKKKPIVIEATQWWPGTHVDGVTELVYDSDGSGTNSAGKGTINTLEGPLLVSPGDWIITGVKGEKYPCKPDIFAATYEPADAHQPRPGADSRDKEGR